MDLLTGPEGEVVGVTISPVMELYSVIDRFVATPRVIALPVAQRFALAGKFAAVPDEHRRIVEKLASSVATSVTEAGALNALYLLETCKELVPGFDKAMPEGRLQSAAELSPHQRVQAAVLLDQKPPEWSQAAQQQAPSQVVLFNTDGEEDFEDKGLVYDAGRVVGDGAKFVGGAALGGVGLVTDTLGLTKGAEDDLADTAEDAVDIVGDAANAVVDTLDSGLDGTAQDFEKKGVAGAVGDGVADAADLMTDFVGGAVEGIAGGVRSALDFLAGDEQAQGASQMHRVAIVQGELFGEERSLGLRIENRIVTALTKPQAAKLGWRIGDCIIGVGEKPVASQEAMLAVIAEKKEALKCLGAPIRFLVERLGPRPA